VDRTHYTVWEVSGKKRDLNQKHSMKESTLVLLYSNSKHLPIVDLFSWVEHSSISLYKRDVLRPLHKNRLVELDESSGIIQISPLKRGGRSRIILLNTIILAFRRFYSKIPG